jgi:uncharacterized protein YjbI with pentapeptide repeats
MANDEDVALLKQGVAAWNKRRRQQGMEAFFDVMANRNPDLHVWEGPMDLSLANLIGADLRGANLSGTNLFITDLTGANLIGADLSGANLSGTCLRGANLSGADLRGTLLLYGP